MRAVLIGINIFAIVILIAGGLKLKHGNKSQIANAVFTMLTCLCMEIGIITGLMYTIDDLSKLTLATASIAIEVLGILWFVKSVFEGTKFIEVMLYKEHQTNKLAIAASVRHLEDLIAEVAKRHV